MTKRLSLGKQKEISVFEPADQVATKRFIMVWSPIFQKALPLNSGMTFTIA